MARQLTHKQKIFVREYTTNGEHGTNAALKAYNTDEVTARAIASENLTKPSIHNEIAKILKRRKIDVESIIDPVIGALSANKTDVEDHSTRLKASSMLQTLTGMTKDNPSSVQFHQHIHTQQDKYTI